MVIIPRGLQPKPKPPTPIEGPTYTYDQMKAFGWIFEGAHFGSIMPRTPDPRIPKGVDPRLPIKEQLR